MRLTLFALLFFALLLVGIANAQCGDCGCPGGIGPGTLNCPGDPCCPGNIDPSRTQPNPCMAVKIELKTIQAESFTPIPSTMQPTSEQLAKLSEASFTAIDTGTPTGHAVAGAKLTAHGPVMPPPDCSYEWNCPCGCNGDGTGCFYGPCLQKQIVPKPTVAQLAKLREASLSAIQKPAPNCHAITGVKLTAHGPVMPPPDNPPGNDPCVCWNDINYLACALGYLTPCW